MTPPVSDNEDAYDKLISALHPSEEGVILEIAILPSSHPREILYDFDPEHPALALPKSLLVQCYLIARKYLFGYLAAPESGQETHDEALKASSVVLLWDPNHNTAANFRKRHMLSLSTQCAENAYISGRQEEGRKLKEAIQTELHLLTSLLTSPLPKHPKSSTLWSHRYWLLQNFSHLYLRLEDTSTSIKENHVTDANGAKLGMGMGIDGERVKKLWEYELGVVMRAGERHPRNYYAWGYARQLWGFVDGKMAECGEGERARVEWMWLEEGMGRVHAWCLMHPRDVSGWGCLVFLMQRVGEGASVGEGGSGSQKEVKRVVWETREWVRKYEWRGESVEWFLKAVGQLQLG